MGNVSLSISQDVNYCFIFPLSIKVPGHFWSRLAELHLLPSPASHTVSQPPDLWLFLFFSFLHSLLLPFLSACFLKQGITLKQRHPFILFQPRKQGGCRCESTGLLTFSLFLQQSSTVWHRAVYLLFFLSGTSSVDASNVTAQMSPHQRWPF